jgi:rod shape-determining protein MreD
VKLTAVFGVVLASVLLQVTLARYTVGGRWVFDFVVAGVVFVALQWGPVAGILAGTLGGLLQDVLAGGIVGMGGLTKTLVGFGAGLVGAQFMLVRPYAKTLVVVVATVIHRLLAIGLSGLIEQHWPSVPWGAMLAETSINGLAALLAFQATTALPGAVARRRDGRRTSFRKRNW